MSKSTTLRSVMSALSLALVATTFVAPAAIACDGNKTDRPAKMVRPLSAIGKRIKHLFSSRNDSTKSEPTDDAGYIPTDDAGELPITP